MLVTSADICMSSLVSQSSCLQPCTPAELQLKFFGNSTSKLMAVTPCSYFACLNICVLLQQAMALSEGQNQDLLYLRHLYITKRSVLHAKRQAYLNETCMGGTEPLHPHADLNHFTNLASVLKETAMQDCKAYHQLCHAVFKGVSMQSDSHALNYIELLLIRKLCGTVCRCNSFTPFSNRDICSLYGFHFGTTHQVFCWFQGCRCGLHSPAFILKA